MTEKQWLRYFSDNLVRMMIDSRISQRELAEMTGLADSTISRFVTGTMMPSCRAIINLSYALDCEAGDLIDFNAPLD